MLTLDSLPENKIVKETQEDVKRIFNLFMEFQEAFTFDGATETQFPVP